MGLYVKVSIIPQQSGIVAKFPTPPVASLQPILVKQGTFCAEPAQISSQECMKKHVYALDMCSIDTCRYLYLAGECTLALAVQRISRKPSSPLVFPSLSLSLSLSLFAPRQCVWLDSSTLIDAARAKQSVRRFPRESGGKAH